MEAFDARGTPLSLVIVDLDHFHAFNETYGHPGGDACLRRVTAEMVMCLRRPSDFLGRYGGEEFIAVLANTDAAGAQIVAERLRAAVEALAIPHAASSCSAVRDDQRRLRDHAPTAPKRGPSRSSQAADSALLRAKADGPQPNQRRGAAPSRRRALALSSQPWRRFPPVVADPWFADRIPQFLATTRNEIWSGARTPATAGELRSHPRASRARLKGSAHRTRHRDDQPSSRTCSSVLRARSDREAIRRVVDELEQYVEHVQVTYRRPLSERRSAPART